MSDNISRFKKRREDTSGHFCVFCVKISDEMRIGGCSDDGVQRISTFIRQFLAFQVWKREKHVMSGTYPLGYIFRLKF